MMGAMTAEWSGSFIEFSFMQDPWMPPAAHLLLCILPRQLKNWAGTGATQIRHTGIHTIT